MLHQIVEIREENRYLSQNRGFLDIRSQQEKIASVPLDDIAVLLVSAQGASFSKAILTELAERGSIAILCGANYVPQAVVTPVTSNYRQTAVLKLQIAASLPLMKGLWQEVVRQKLTHQELTLRSVGKEAAADRIRHLAAQVHSGDPENREGAAARLYWQALFGKDFVRNREAGGINALLNYGYAVMRAAMIRSLISSGAHPALGIHHKNMLDPFCLADDLFEIYRPLVDLIVYNLSQEADELSPPIKKRLIEALWIRLKTTEGNSPAFQSMHYLVSSYVSALQKGRKEFSLPVWEGSVETVPRFE